MTVDIKLYGAGSSIHHTHVVFRAIFRCKNSRLERGWGGDATESGGGNQFLMDIGFGDSMKEHLSLFPLGWTTRRVVVPADSDQLRMLLFVPLQPGVRFYLRGGADSEARSSSS